MGCFFQLIFPALSRICSYQIQPVIMRLTDDQIIADRCH